MAALQKCRPFTDTGSRHIQPCVRYCQPARRRQAGKKLSVKAEGERFDETAASVRRLLKRDRKDLQASSATWQPEWDDISDDTEAQQSSSRGPGTASTSEPSGQGVAAPKSPFGSDGGFFEGSSSNGKPAKSPFGGSSRSANPFGDTSDLYTEAEAMEEDDQEWWQKIGFGQVVLALSFVLAGGLMFVTFYVTLKLGGISLNE